MKDDTIRAIKSNAGITYTYTKLTIHEGVQAGDFVIVNDDGKRGRESIGKVLSIIDKKRIVVEFDVFGYNEIATLVFQVCAIVEGLGYEALNPRPIEFISLDYPSEYCLVSGKAMMV